MLDSIVTCQLFLIYVFGLYNFANMSLVHSNYIITFHRLTIHHTILFISGYLHSEGSST